MATWDRYLSNRTGFEIRAFKGRTFRPRFYCDDASTGVYITKAPVAVLSLDPVVQFVSTNVAWDVSQSNSATGTIDTFDLTFGGGGASDLTAQDWSSDPLTGNVQYNATGIYTVSLVVTDTLGNVSQTAKQTVHVVSLAGISRAYVTTDDSGVFAHQSGTLSQLSGLSGGDLQVASGALNPHFAGLLTTQHHFWCATANGIAYTTDGGQTWSTIAWASIGDPTNTAGDGSPPDNTDLDALALVFCPQDIMRVYLLAATDSTWNASNSPRVFLYWSDDYGASWSSVGIGV